MCKRLVWSVTLVLALSAMACGATMAEFYVAPNGRDTRSGSKAAPFATLERARDAVRGLKAAGKMPSGGCTVWLRGGTYELTKPLELTATDAGTASAPITYRAYSGEHVCLVGGKTLKDFTPVTDPAILGRLDAPARGKVWQTDLRAQGITTYGAPVVTDAIEGSTRPEHQRMEFFFDDEPMTLARWPNTGFVTVKDVVPGERMDDGGVIAYRVGHIIYDGDRANRWLGEKDAHLFGYWCWDWGSSYERIASIETPTRMIKLAPPHHGYGYRKGQRYYALNLLCELDAPGEWYLDRDTGILYFWPPAPIAGQRMAVSLTPTLVTMREVSYLTLRNLTLETTSGTAVEMRGGSHALIAGCTIRNTGGWAVKIQGGTENGVLGCDIYNTGDGGVILEGGNRDTLTPAKLFAENNHISRFSRINRVYRPAVLMDGVGHRASHNLIHDAPHNAIQFNGNDHLIEYNEIFDVCKETGDVGAIYTGRNWTFRGTMIRYNYFHDITGPGLYGANAVYLDDQVSGISVFGNLFYQAGRAAFIGGGRDITVENNIFVDCPASVHVDARGLNWARKSESLLTERMKAMPYRTPPWSVRYPQLLTLLEDHPMAPKGNVIVRNISWRGHWLDVEDIAKPFLQFTDNLVNVDPHFVDAGKRNFQLRDDSPAYALGFTRIPLENIGLYQDSLRASWPVKRK